MKNQYPDFISRLLVHPRKLERLFPPEPNDYEQVIRIRETPDTTLFDGVALRQIPAPCWVRGGLFYWFDALEEALTFVGASSDPHSCYWRAMIFRRLGDMENARRNLEKTGQHPVYQDLHARVSESCPTMAKQLSWDPYVFLTMAEQHRFGAEDDIPELIRLQKTEFEVIFRYSWEQTIDPLAVL